MQIKSIFLVLLLALTIFGCKNSESEPFDKVKLKTELAGENIFICLRDDGRGLQLDKLRDRAILLKKWKQRSFFF